VRKNVQPVKNTASVILTGFLGNNQLTKKKLDTNWLSATVLTYNVNGVIEQNLTSHSIHNTAGHFGDKSLEAVNYVVTQSNNHVTYKN